MNDRLEADHLEAERLEARERRSFESPLRLRRRVAPHVRQARALARPYKIEVRRFSRFLVVGTIGFVVDVSAFNLFSHALGVAPAIAGAISLVCAIISNFLFNHYWVYHDARGRLPVQFAQFFVVSIAMAVVRVPLITLTHVPLGDLAGLLLGLPAGPAEIVGNNLALILAVIIGLIWNFLANRLWTYRHAPRG
jgi:putative flippase GtrA